MTSASREILRPTDGLRMTESSIYSVFPPSLICVAELTKKPALEAGFFFTSIDVYALSRREAMVATFPRGAELNALTAFCSSS